MIGRQQVTGTVDEPAGRSPVGLLRRGDAALVIVDVQEAFRVAVTDFERVAQRTSVLLAGARILGLPVVVTEQYPQGLGSTVPEVGLNDELVLEKSMFAATRATGFDLADRRQAIVCGMEAHICVHQTVQELVRAGVETHLCVDAIGSRNPADQAIAEHRAERGGAVLTTVEMALFELCERAGSPEFRAVQALIR